MAYSHAHVLQIEKISFDPSRRTIMITAVTSIGILNHAKPFTQKQHFGSHKEAKVKGKQRNTHTGIY